LGLTRAQVRIIGTKASYDLRLLVDTRSIYTWIEKKILDKVGVRDLGTRKFTTIEGRDIERQFGEAVIESSGVRATRMVVYAGERDAQVLGVDSLEGLGLEVDPTSKRLKKVESFIAYVSQRGQEWAVHC
jgi:predicted aspartyl protease